PGPVPAAARIRAAEALERPVNELRREPCSLVAHVQLEPAVDRGHAKAHLARAVADSDVEQVAQRLLEPSPVTDQSQPVRRLNDAPTLLGLRPPWEPRAGALQQLARVESLEAKRQPAAIRACDQQQVARQLHEAIRLVACRLQRGPELLL